MKNKERKLVYWNLIIAISITLLLIWFSFTGMFNEAGEGITGDAISTQADEDFIFTFSPMEIRNNGDSYREARINEIKDMMATGMNHVNLRVWPSYPSDSVINSYLQDLEGYNLIQEISAGHEKDNGTPKGLLELVNANADSGKQFLSTSCIEQNKSICENWNKTQLISPAYKGTLWSNTINNTITAAGRIKTAAGRNPDLVFFDTEIWTKPENLKWFYEYGDPGKNCSCRNVVEDAIGIQKYYTEWKQRGLDLKNAVKSVNPGAEVYFYHEIPEGETRYTPLPNGSYTGRDIGYMPAGTGDEHATSLYVLPNLEILEMNMESMDLSGALVFISPTYLYGYSDYFKYTCCSASDLNGDWKDDIFFDLSVSREAGRMLREEGVRGFSVYPNIYVDQLFHGSRVHDYWLNHTKELIAGFLEEDYIERNKIRNPGFEAFKTKGAGEKGYNETLYFTSGYIGSTLIEPVQFSPVFWTWQDSGNYKDNATTSALVEDKQSGTYSWRHTRMGDIGNRTIYSRKFEISENNNYTFSIFTKASSTNGKIKFYLVDTTSSSESKIGETNFQASWNSFKQNININSGDYKLKIFIEDKTGQKVDIYFDNVSLIKGSIAIECGNGNCNGNENCSNCPRDCGACPLVNETCQERGYYCLAPSNCSSSDRRDYNCDSGVCCSKLPNMSIIIPQDKTCAELNGKICNVSAFCNGTISWAKDSNKCCLGNCETEVTTISDGEKPNNLWFYWFVGGIGAAIVGVVSYIIYEVNKRRDW